VFYSFHIFHRKGGKRKEGKKEGGRERGRGVNYFKKVNIKNPNAEEIKSVCMAPSFE
jgi:hypothetical protein